MSLAGLATNFVWPLREYFEYEPNSDETWVRPPVMCELATRPQFCMHT